VFRVNLFCDDKKLADVLRGLAGLAVGNPEVQPVVNAEKKNGKVVAAGSGDNAALFAKYAKTNKLTKIKATDLRGFCKSIGVSETSYGYFGKQLQKAGAIKKHGTGSASYYTVTA
jgi:hypothetical protein